MSGGRRFASFRYRRSSCRNVLQGCDVSFAFVLCMFRTSPTRTFLSLLYSAVPDRPDKLDRSFVPCKFLSLRYRDHGFAEIFAKYSAWLGKNSRLRCLWLGKRKFSGLLCSLGVNREAGVIVFAIGCMVLCIRINKTIRPITCSKCRRCILELFHVLIRLIRIYRLSRKHLGNMVMEKI